MKYIELTKDKKTIIDDEDFEYLSQWKWYFGGRYVQRQQYLGKINGKYKQKTIYLHRVVLPTDKIVDHINGDTLDNRKDNLRSVEHYQNMYNQKVRKTNTSGVRGVSFHKQSGKWAAQIQYGGKKRHLGLFTDIEDAKKAYDIRAEQTFGIFARKEV